MLPGKTLNPEDLLAIAWRRRWVLVFPPLLIAIASFAVSGILPKQYRSETLIRVVPQRVPESYVRSTVRTRIEERLPSIGQQILSRTQLERVMLDLNLYPEERRTNGIDAVLDQMRADVTVDLVQPESFRVSYVASDPQIAQMVTERLASFFIQENLRDREAFAEATSGFLEAQLEDARRRLVEQEKKLEAYRLRYTGELPSQLESNLQVLNNTEMQVQATVESINRDRDRRLVLERLAQELERDDQAEGSRAADPRPDAPGSQMPGASLDAPLHAARASLLALQARLTPEHPDVLAAMRAVRDLEAQAEEAAQRAPAARPRAPTPADIARVNRRRDVRAEIENLDRQLANKQAEEQRLRRTIALSHRRVEAAPTRESELIALTRDYDTLKGVYTSLLSKKEEAKISENLERREIGEQFKIIDSAQIRQKPFRPDRVQLTLFGLLAGVLLGVGLTALLEHLDATFRTDEDVMSTLALPVLAMIPTMTAPGNRHERARQWLFVFGTAAALAGGIATLVIWVSSF